MVTPNNKYDTVALFALAYIAHVNLELLFTISCR